MISVSDLQCTLPNSILNGHLGSKACRFRQILLPKKLLKNIIYIVLESGFCGEIIFRIFFDIVNFYAFE